MLLCKRTNNTKEGQDKVYHSRGGSCFDVGSLYAQLQGLKANRKPRGVHYPLVAVLVMMVMDTLFEEDTSSGMAD